VRPLESWLCLLLLLVVGSSLAAETRRDPIDPSAIVKALKDSAHGADSPIIVLPGVVVFTEPGGTAWINFQMGYEPLPTPMKCGNRW